MISEIMFVHFSVQFVKSGKRISTVKLFASSINEQNYLLENFSYIKLICPPYIFKED